MTTTDSFRALVRQGRAEVDPANGSYLVSCERRSGRVARLAYTHARRAAGERREGS